MEDYGGNELNELEQETALLNFRHPTIQSLVAVRGWTALPREEMIKRVYLFVRDEIQFGYNRSDSLPASKILADGYGQCNTKGILFMTLLRALHVPCRFHGFTIDKRLQKGAITGIWYRLAPREIVHSWVELENNGRWINVEGFILDQEYLASVQAANPDTQGEFCGYGVATDCLASPQVDWSGSDTYIQKEGIVQDFGVFADPDTFFLSHSQTLGPLKRFLFENVTRHIMNRAVDRIRRRG